MRGFDQCTEADPKSVIGRSLVEVAGSWRPTDRLGETVTRSRDGDAWHPPLSAM